MARTTLILYGVLITSLFGLGAVSEHALDLEDATARNNLRVKADETARLTVLAVRAALAQVEEAAGAGRAQPGIESFTVALPPTHVLPEAPGSPYAGRPRDELQKLLESRVTTETGLPEAAVAAVALGLHERKDAVAEQLLEGKLPVLPDDLPTVAAALGHDGDPRIAPLQMRLRAVPARNAVPLLPAFRRDLRGETVAGDALNEHDWIHYEAPTAALLAMAGARGKARLATGTAGAVGVRAAVPDVDGLVLEVTADQPARLRLYLLRALLWGSVGSAIAGIAMLLSGIARQARAMRREKLFLGSVTHELRTPLAAIRVLGETLARGRGNAAEYGELVARESERLEVLVERVLAATRADQAPLFAPSRPEEIVRSAIALVEPRGERRSVSISSDLGEGLPCTSWDGDAVRRALLNLLDNAIRHGREGGHVVVRARAGDGHVTLAVEDDGPGIQRKDRRRIFGRFERGATTAPGTGLGLYLVEQVARSHGGRVDLETADGRGCTFSLVLPIEPAASKGRPPAP